MTVKLLMLNRNKSKFAGFLLFLVFFTNCQNQTEYQVLLKQDKLLLLKNGEEEIRFINDRWSLRHEIKGKEVWSTVWTPFEAKYNQNYKFIFVSSGKIFWVSNDKTSVREVKLIEGSWKFKSEITEEWKSFDTTN